MYRIPNFPAAVNKNEQERRQALVLRHPERDLRQEAYQPFRRGACYRYEQVQCDRMEERQKPEAGHCHQNRKAPFDQSCKTDPEGVTTTPTKNLFDSMAFYIIGCVFGSLFVRVTEYFFPPLNALFFQILLVIVLVFSAMFIEKRLRRS